MTLEELKECLAQRVDEITLLEILNIKSNDIVEAFESRIEDRFDSLCAEFSDEDNTDVIGLQEGD
jgi:hypothetical protein